MGEILERKQRVLVRVREVAQASPLRLGELIVGALRGARVWSEDGCLEAGRTLHVKRHVSEKNPAFLMYYPIYTACCATK